MPLYFYSQLTNYYPTVTPIIYTASSTILPSAITAANVVAWYNPYYVTFSGATSGAGSSITKWQNTKAPGTMDLDKNSGTNYTLYSYSGGVGGLQMVNTTTKTNYLLTTNQTLVNGYVVMVYIGNNGNVSNFCMLIAPTNSNTSTAQDYSFRWPIQNPSVIAANWNSNDNTYGPNGRIDISGSTVVQYNSNSTPTTTINIAYSGYKNTYAIYYVRSADNSQTGAPFTYTYNTTNVCIQFSGQANGDRGFVGYYGDLICLGPNHTYADAQAAEGYLAWKWFGSNNPLPDNHPWKTTAPT